MRADFTNTTVNAPVVDFTNTSSIQYVLSAPPGRRLIVERSITMNAFKFVLDETYISYRNNCLPNPCLNNGVCVEGVNTYRCNCPSTATGTNCELIINAAANYRFCPTAQQFYLSTTTKAVFIGFYFNFTLTPFSAPSAPVTLTIYSTNTTVATVIPATYTIPVGSNVKINISCLGKAEGTTFIRINTSSADPLWNRTTIPPTTLTVFNATLLNGTFPDNYQNGTNVTSTVQYVCCNPQLNPCQNGGTCVTRSDQRSYTCNCPSTTTGLHCEKSPWIVPTYYPNIAQVQNISSDVCVSFDGLVGASPEYSVNNVFFSVQGIYVRIGVTLNFAKRDSSQRKGVTFQNMRITLTPRLALNRTLSVIQNVTYINTTTNLPYNVTQPVLVALPPTYYQKYWGNVYFIGDAPNLIAAYRFAAVVDDSAAWGSQVISDAPRPVVLGHVYGDSLIEKYQDLSPTTQAVTSSIDLERGVIYLPRWHGIDTATLYTYQDALAQCAALPSASAGSPYTVCSKAALQATALRLNYSSCDRGWLSDVKFETLPNGDQVTKHLVGFLMNYVDEKCGNKTGFFGDDADPTKNPSGTGFYEDLKYLTGVYCCGSAPTVDLSYFVSTQFKIVAPLNHIFAVNYYSRYTSLTLALNYELKRETGAVSGTRFPLDLCVTFEDYTSNLQPRTNFASGSLDLLGNQLLLSANLTLQRTVSFSSLIISMSLRTGMTNPNLQFNLTTGTFSIRGVGGPGYGAPLSILPSAYQCAPSCSNVIGHPLTLTDFTATFNDGSGDKEYANNASCEWVIAPVAADRVSVKFTYLKTEDSVDYVEIWESNGAVATTLRGSYSGSVDTSTFVPIVSSGPTMIVRVCFFTFLCFVWVLYFILFYFFSISHFHFFFPLIILSVLLKPLWILPWFWYPL